MNNNFNKKDVAIKAALAMGKLIARISLDETYPLGITICYNEAREYVLRSSLDHSRFELYVENKDIRQEPLVICEIRCYMDDALIAKEIAAAILVYEKYAGKTTS